MRLLPLLLIFLVACSAQVEEPIQDNRSDPQAIAQPTIEGNLVTYDPGVDVEEARTDCEQRGGEFNPCSSPCEEGEFCVQVCVPICTLPEPETEPAQVEVANTIQEVRVKNFDYQPSVVEVTKGQTVRWTNVDGQKHTVSSVGDAFDSGAMGARQTFEHTFTEPGEYVYTCRFHPSMKGQVIVR